MNEQTHRPSPTLPSHAASPAPPASLSQRISSQPLDLSQTDDHLSETHSWSKPFADSLGLPAPTQCCGRLIKLNYVLLAYCLELRANYLHLASDSTKCEDSSLARNVTFAYE